MVMTRDEVVVVIPTFNEENNIAQVIRELSQLGFRNVLVIDGNSNDRTAEVAKAMGAKVLMQHGSGKGVALRQAFDCVGDKAEMIIMMDGDGSMSPKEVPTLLDVLVKETDLVKGSRFLPGGGSEDLNTIRNIGNKFFLLLVNILWSSNYTDLCYGFGAVRKSALKRLYPLLDAKNFEIETEICIKVKKLGLKLLEVPSIELRRTQGKSNLRIVRDGLRILRVILKEFINKYRDKY